MLLTKEDLAEFENRIGFNCTVAAMAEPDGLKLIAYSIDPMTGAQLHFSYSIAFSDLMSILRHKQLQIDFCSRASEYFALHMPKKEQA